MIRTIGQAAIDNHVGDVSQAIEEQTGQAFDKAVASFDGKERSMVILKDALEKLVDDYHPDDYVPVLRAVILPRP